MQVVLNFESALVASSVEDLMKSLSPEDKKLVAIEVTKTLLCGAGEGERSIEEARFIAHMRAGDSLQYGKNNAELPDSEFRGHYTFTRHMEKWRSIKDRMIEGIVAAASKTFEEEVRQLVRSDPKVQADMTVVLEQVREGFPAAAHRAVVSWFSSHMANISATADQAFGTAVEVKFKTDDLARKLNLPV